MQDLCMCVATHRLLYSNEPAIFFHNLCTQMRKVSGVTERVFPYPLTLLAGMCNQKYGWLARLYRHSLISCYITMCPPSLYTSCVPCVLFYSLSLLRVGVLPPLSSHCIPFPPFMCVLLYSLSHLHIGVLLPLSASLSLLPCVFHLTLSPPTCLRVLSPPSCIYIYP